MTQSSQRGHVLGRPGRRVPSLPTGPVVARRLRAVRPAAAGRRRRRRWRQLVHVHMLEPFGTDHGAV